MEDYLQFENREEFRQWLSTNYASEAGVWLRFSKTKDITTVKATQALEEALCFGWIDGQMKKIDEDSYLKYFTQRRKNSNWSEKNKQLIAKLESNGQMTDVGRQKIDEAKTNGTWATAAKPQITAEDIEAVAQLLAVDSLAFTNFQKMAPSVKKTYTRAYLDAKTEAGKEKRLAWMLERLRQNLKPM